MQSIATQDVDTAPPPSPALLSATLADDGRHTDAFTPIVPPPRTLKTSPLPPTVVVADGTPAVIQASEYAGRTRKARHRGGPSPTSGDHIRELRPSGSRTNARMRTILELVQATEHRRVARVGVVDDGDRRSGWG